MTHKLTFLKLFFTLSLLVFFLVVLPKNAYADVCDQYQDEFGNTIRNCILISGWVRDKNTNNGIDNIQVRITNVTTNAAPWIATTGLTANQDAVMAGLENRGRFMLSTDGGKFSVGDRFNVEVVGASLPAGYDSSLTKAVGGSWTWRACEGRDTNSNDVFYNCQAGLTQSPYDNGDNCTQNSPIGPHRCSFTISPSTSTPPTSTPTPNPVNASFGALKIREYDDAAAGTYGTSKLRVSQGGTNILNPIEVVQLVTNGTPTSYKLVATAFTNKGTPPATGTGHTLTELRNSTAGVNGFVLLYANQTTTTDGRNFPADTYWVSFNGGTWNGPYDIGDNFGSSSLGIQIKPIVTNRTKPGTTEIYSEREAPTFKVIFYSAITGGAPRTWGNYSYLMDNSGQSISVQSPSQ